MYKKNKPLKLKKGLWGFFAVPGSPEDRAYRRKAKAFKKKYNPPF